MFTGEKLVILKLALAQLEVKCMEDMIEHKDDIEKYIGSSEVRSIINEMQREIGGVKI